MIVAQVNKMGQHKVFTQTNITPVAVIPRGEIQMAAGGVPEFVIVEGDKVFWRVFNTRGVAFVRVSEQDMAALALQSQVNQNK